MVLPPIPWPGDESSRAALCVPQIGVRGAFLARAAHYREGTADSSTDTTDISEFPCASVYTHVSVSIFGPIVYQEWLVSVSRTVGYCLKSGWRVRRDALRTHRERREITSSIVGKYAVRSDGLAWDEMGCHMFTSLTLRDCHAFLAYLTAPYSPLTIEALMEYRQPEHEPGLLAELPTMSGCRAQADAGLLV